MIVAIFRNVGRSSMVFISRCRWRQLFASSAVLLAILLFSPVMELPASFASAQIQMQLNKEACDEYKKADAEMNDVYRRINRDYRDDAGFIAALKKAQLAWIRYRDAHLESVFPGDPSQYGSINAMCRCTNLAEITKERTRVLKRWVEGIEEGDVCAGSVKIR
jgi:uncharacterized protein YecT (DUF1311 family)